MRRMRFSPSALSEDDLYLAAGYAPAGERSAESWSYTSGALDDDPRDGGMVRHCLSRVEGEEGVVDASLRFPGYSASACMYLRIE